MDSKVWWLMVGYDSKNSGSIDLFPLIRRIEKKKWNDFLWIHFLDGTVSPFQCICAAFTASLPVAPSSFLYSFDFFFGHVSQQITRWALLVKDSSMLRHEENLCLFVTYFVLRVYTMLSCMLTCTHNSFYLMRAPHGSRLLQARV